MSEDPFARVERAIAAACFDRDAEERLAADPRAFLAAQGLTEEEIALFAPHADRLTLYRTLVRNNLGQVVFQVLPRTRALFTRAGALPPKAFDDELVAFLAEAGPRGHTLREVPRELVAWATPRWRALGDAVPPWAVELASHELLVFEVASDEARTTTAPGEIGLDRGVLFAPATRLARYTHAVHDEGASPPEAREVFVLVFRDEEDSVQELELGPFGAALVESLLEDATLGGAVVSAAEAIDSAPEAHVDEAAAVLAELATAGAVLGGRVEA